MDVELKNIFSRFISSLIIQFTRTVTGMRPFWRGCTPEAVQRIYFANHTSHGDFLLLWAALPPELRKKTRPVAGLDYWENGFIRKFLIKSVFHGVLISRASESPAEASRPINEALELGDSIIIFPEGTRNIECDSLLPFKSGIFYFAKSFPHVEVIPVWIENINRVLPKGEIIPVPLLCSLFFGPPLEMADKFDKEAYLDHAKNSLLALSPKVNYE